MISLSVGGRPLGKTCGHDFAAKAELQSVPSMIQSRKLNLPLIAVCISSLDVIQVMEQMCACRTICANLLVMNSCKAELTWVLAFADLWIMTRDGARSLRCPAVDHIAWR